MKATEETNALRDIKEELCYYVAESGRCDFHELCLRGCSLYLRYDIMHVAPGVVGAIVVAETV